MLSTDFTMTMSDGSDANDQSPLPGSGDIANTYFEAQPTSGVEVTTSNDSDDDDMSALQVVFLIAGIGVFILLMFSIYSYRCSHAARSHHRRPHEYIIVGSRN